MHNVTWDYPVSGAAMRSTYGLITDTSTTERRRRITRLESLDTSWATNRRFVSNAWPEGFQGGAVAACPSGTVRVSNGGGCGPSGLASSVYIGPYAAILGGTVSGSSRIEDQAIVVSGSVTDSTVGALSLIGSKGGYYSSNSFNVTGGARAYTTFYPLGFFEAGQSISGSAVLEGDVELRGASYQRSSGSCSGFVDSATCTTAGTEVTVAPPYTWR